MKRTSTKILLSLTSLAVLSASSLAFAQEDAQAPSLEGGFTAYIGAFYAVPSANDLGYYVNPNTTLGFFDPLVNVNNNVLNANSDYDWGFQAMIGYVFDETANGIELSYRGFSSDKTSSADASLLGFTNDMEVSGYQKNEYQNWDLMISQFLDIGNHFQMRFLGGLSYLSELKQVNDDDYEFDLLEPFFEAEADRDASSKFSGWGPRVGADARYDFGDDLEGFGIVGGASIAYFVGDLDTSNNSSAEIEFFEALELGLINVNTTNNPENHAVTNLRANLGIDWVYYFEDQDLPTLGLELGYQIDRYLDGVAYQEATGGINYSDVTFSGPYLNLKGVF